MDQKGFIMLAPGSNLIVGDPQGILGEQLRPFPVDLLNISFIILIQY
jgi:hypothetical protein